MGAQSCGMVCGSFGDDDGWRGCLPQDLCEAGGSGSGFREV